MAINTAIHWCDDTVNPTLGCDGCELCHHKKRKPSDKVPLPAEIQLENAIGDEHEDVCYANEMTQRFGGVNKGYPDFFWEVSTAPGRMKKAACRLDSRGKCRENKPWLNGLPKLVFVSDMADALSKAIGFDYLKEEIIDNVSSKKGSRHEWLWLTKRPKRMADFSNWLASRNIQWPTNLWVGTSVTSSKVTSRIDHLLDVGDENTLRFLSVEPQWEQIDLRPWLGQLDWVIQGGQSGDKSPKPFHTEWVADMVSHCRDAKAPLFVKQLGSYAYEGGERIDLEDSHGGDWSEWPKSLRVRQMPIYFGSKKHQVRQRKVA